MVGYGWVNFKLLILFHCGYTHPDQVEHQLDKDLTPSSHSSRSTGVLERYLPTNAILKNSEEQAERTKQA